MKVIRVTKTEFELEDGRVIPHFIELDEKPTLKAFQKIYDSWTDKFNAMEAEAASEADAKPKKTKKGKK